VSVTHRLPPHLRKTFRAMTASHVKAPDPTAWAAAADLLMEAGFAPDDPQATLWRCRAAWWRPMVDAVAAVWGPAKEWREALGARRYGLCWDDLPDVPPAECALAFRVRLTVRAVPQRRSAALDLDRGAGDPTGHICTFWLTLMADPTSYRTATGVNRTINAAHGRLARLNHWRDDR
jgi:hypothetical protein